MNATQIEWFSVAFRQVRRKKKSTNAQFISYYRVIELMKKEPSGAKYFLFCFISLFKEKRIGCISF